MEAINKQKNDKKKSQIKKLKWKKKPERTVLLRDKLHDILTHFDMKVNAKRENILKKLAADERIIN